MTESPRVQASPEVSDLKHTPQHKTAWLNGEEEGGGGSKTVTPHRYLVNRDSGGRAGKYHIERYDVLYSCSMIHSLQTNMILCTSDFPWTPVQELNSLNWNG